MSTRKLFPTLFVSHGAPDIVLSKNSAAASIQQLADTLPLPQSIVIISAHWISQPVTITAPGRLDTIHDFGGFPPELYKKQYPANGDAEVSARITQLLSQHGIEFQIDPQRGLDHGAWIPLLLMYPEAAIPVTQVSLPSGSLQDLAALGTALAPLREEGVLIIGSGGSVHNLRALSHTGKTDAWASEFEQWLLSTVEGNHFNRLITAANFPASMHHAHPTLEHFAPLIVAWAAASLQQPGRRLHHSFSYGNLGMSHYRFGEQDDIAGTAIG